MSHWRSDWDQSAQPLVPYILRLTHSKHGDGVSPPDRMWLVGPFADKFARANYISRHNPKAEPGWIPISVPVIVPGGALAVFVIPPEGGR